jgi:hypothetical protein
VRKREGKGTPEGSRRRWENFIKTDLNEVEWEGVDWIDVAADRDKRWDFVNAAMKHRVS